MIYMRTQLKMVEVFGGAFLRPVFLEFPSMQNTTDVTQVMYGSSIMVDFAFEANQTHRDVDFPKEYDWVNLNTMETIAGGDFRRVNVSIKDGLSMY